MRWKNVKNKTKQPDLDSQVSNTERDGVVEKLQSELKLLLDKFKETEDENHRLHSNMQELDIQHQQALDVLCCQKTQLESEFSISKESLSNAEVKIVELQSLVQPKQPQPRQSEDGNLKLSSLSNLMSQNQQLIVEMHNLKKSKIYKPIGPTAEDVQSTNKDDITTQLQLQLEKSNLLIQQLTDAKLTAEGEIVTFTNNLEESIQRLSMELNAKSSEDKDSGEGEEPEGNRTIAYLKKYAEQSELTNMRQEAVIEQLHNDNDILRKKYFEELQCRQTVSDELSNPNADSVLSHKENDPKHEQALRCLEELMGNCSLTTMEELPSAIREKDSEIARLRCERDKLQEEFDSTVHELKDSQEVVEALVSEKLDLESECEELRDQLEELQYGKREEPEGSISRTLTTIEEEEAEPGEDQARAQNEAGRSDEAVARKDRISQYKLEIVSLTDKCNELQRTIVTLKSGHPQQDSLVSERPLDASYSDQSNILEVSEEESSASLETEAEPLLSDKHLTEMNLLRAQVIFKDDQIDELRDTVSNIGQLFGVREYNLRETFCAAKRQVFQGSANTINPPQMAAIDADGGDGSPPVAGLPPPTDSQRECQLSEFLQKSLTARRKDLLEFRVNKAHFCPAKEQELLEAVGKLEHLMDYEDERKNDQFLFAKIHQALKSQFDTLETYNGALTLKVSELAAEKSQLIVNYEHSLTARNEECFQKNELILQLQHDLTCMHTCVAQNDEIAKEKLAALEETIRSMKTDGADLSMSDTALKVNEVACQVTLEEINKEKAELIERLTLEKEDLTNEYIKEVNNDKLKWEEKESVYQSQQSNLNAELAQLKKTSEDHQVANAELENNVLKLNNCLETKTKELLDATEKLSMVKQDASQQHIINEEYEAKILDLNNCIETKVKELVDANENISRLTLGSSQQQLINDETQNQTVQLNNSLEMKKRELLEASEKISKLQQDFSQQQTINEEIKSQILDTANNLVVKERELLEANDNISKLTLKSEQQQQSNCDTTDKMLQLNTYMETKAKELLESNESLSRLKHDFAQQKLLIDEIERTNLHLVNSLEMKTKELLDANENISKLQHGFAEQRLFTDDIESKTLQLNNCIDTTTKELYHANEIISRNQSEFKRLEESMKNIMNQNEQVMTANTAFNAQYEAISKELASGQEKERHLHTECDRLRQHLVEIEESHTTELVQAEQREAALKQTMAKLHEKMASHSNLYSSNNMKNADRVEILQESLKNAVLHRDEALQKLEVSEMASLENEESLRSLNQVLLDFQKSYNKDVREATEKDRREMEKERDRSCELQQQINSLQTKIEDLELSTSVSHQLRTEIQTKQSTIVGLQSQVSAMEDEVKKSQNHLQLLQTSTEVRVEKNLVRNLFVGYFASPSDKQREVLHIIAQTLDFSPSERVRTGLDTNPNSWMTSLANFLAPPPSNMRVTSKVDLLDHSSLSQRFIQFLEEESAVRPHAKLPAIEMAEQASQKAQKKAQSKASNAAAVPNYSPLIDTPLSSAQSVVLQTVNSQEPSEEPSKLSEEKYLKILLNDTSIVESS